MTNARASTRADAKSVPVQGGTPDEHTASSSGFDSSESDPLVGPPRPADPGRRGKRATNDYGSAGKGEDASSDDEGKKRVVVSAIANLSTAYNPAVINYALLMIRRSHPPSSALVTSAVVSCSLAGAIVGQLTFGYVGDALGRRKGMILTLLLSIVGALASAVLPWGDGATIYPILAVCRFVLGLGNGGVYPLSATSAADASDDDTQNKRTVSAVFSFQGVGQLLAPLVAYVLLALGVSRGLAWRILLAVGAAPGLVVLKSAIDTKDDNEERSGRDSKGPSRSLLEMVRNDSGLLRKLIGAGLGWFLFNVTFYGNTIFTPVILQDTFGLDSSQEKDVAAYSIVVAAVGLPGYLATVLAVGRIEFKAIQIIGFTAMAALFAGLGFFYDQLQHATAVMLTLYALTFFFSNFGPHVSTFCLPTEIFSAESRVKLNGIAAASGQVGATVGAALFGVIESEFGVAQVLVMSGVVSLLGTVVTMWCIPDKKHA